MPAASHLQAFTPDLPMCLASYLVLYKTSVPPFGLPGLGQQVKEGELDWWPQHTKVPKGPHGLESLLLAPSSSEHPCPGDLGTMWGL